MAAPASTLCLDSERWCEDKPSSNLAEFAWCAGLGPQNSSPRHPTCTLHNYSASTVVARRPAMMVANPTYTRIALRPEGYQSCQDFYPFYVGEHSTATCLRLHVVGTTGTVGLAAMAAWTLQPKLLLVVGYGLAWLGHLFECNRPATFKHPIYSLLGDFRMWWEVITRQRAF